jgi:hypothetical protein
MATQCGGQKVEQRSKKVNNGQNGQNGQVVKRDVTGPPPKRPADGALHLVKTLPSNSGQNVVKTWSKRGQNLVE